MKIGIFWFYKHQLLAKACDFSQSNADSLGLIDSPFTHIDVWQQLKNTNPQLVNFEYEQLPRGRIIFDCNRQKALVYLDQKLMTKQKAELIRQFFELEKENCLFFKDPHYRT